MYYKIANKNVTKVKARDLSLLFKVCNTLVGEFVTFLPTVSTAHLVPYRCIYLLIKFLVRNYIPISR
jgi:hypothetical protein